MLSIKQIDPFLGISDDYQVYTKIHVEASKYGTAADNQLAISTISELQNKIGEYKQIMKDILVQNLASITKVLQSFHSDMVSWAILATQNCLIFSFYILLSWMPIALLHNWRKCSGLMKNLCLGLNQFLIRITRLHIPRNHCRLMGYIFLANCFDNLKLHLKLITFSLDL